MSSTIDIPQVRPRVWLRNRESGVRAGGILFAGMTLVMLLVPIYAVIRWPGETIGAILGCVALFGALAASFGLVAIRLFRVGVWIDADGVVIRDYLKTSRVPLDQIDAFVTGREELGGGVLRTTYGVRLRRKDSFQYFVRALHDAGWNSKKGADSATARWQPICDELNALVASLR